MATSFTFQCFVYISIIVCSISAVPLSRVISDSLRMINNSTADGSELPFVTPEIADDVETALNLGKRFPPQHGENEQPTNETSSSVEEQQHAVLERKRREVHAPSADCVVSPNSPVVESSASNVLNSSTYLGVNPSRSEVPSIPDNQLNACPSNAVWSTLNEMNYLSTCPWKYVVKDLAVEHGHDIYPRYLREAKCLCRECFESGTNQCTELRQEVTVFEKIGCHSGLAVMAKKSVFISSGCYCRKSTPNSSVSTARSSNDGFTISP